VGSEMWIRERRKASRSWASSAGPAVPVQLLQLVTDKYFSFFFFKRLSYTLCWLGVWNNLSWMQMIMWVGPVHTRNVSKL